MNIDFLWKTLLLLSIGAVGAWGLIKILSPSPSPTSPVLGQEMSIDEKVKRIVQKQEGEKINSFRNKIVDKVLPAITQNPILSPLLQTTREVEEAIQTVKNLPEDQKNAICQQICQ